MLNDVFKNIVRSDIQALKAYHVAETPTGCLKLDAMESPYAYPPKMQQELGALLGKAPINLYPDIAHHAFVPQLKIAHTIPNSAELVLGNGSDELIQMLTMLVAKPNAKILGIEPTFVMYRHNAALYGLEYIGVDVEADLTLNIERVLTAIQAHQPALIWVSYPNNPTGTRYCREDVEKIIQAATGLVVVDEAYGAFSADSFLLQAGQPENLLVLRTLSKIGYAGLRVGYLSGCPDLIAEIKKITPPYNMNQLSLTAAQYALAHHQWIDENVQTLKMAREVLFAQLEEIKGLDVFPSEANFLTIRVPNADSCVVFFRQNNVLIKNLHGAHPLLENCVRITVSKEEDNLKVLALLKQCALQGN